MDGPTLTPDESSLARVVHADTGRERCADWLHVAAPVEPGITTGTVTPRKPEADDLGIDLAALDWQRSGDGDGCIEVAFPDVREWKPGDWVLMRVAGDPDDRVLVYDRNEWECFLDGARNGEFNDLAEPAAF